MKIVNFLLQSSTTEKYPKHLSELYPRNTQEIGSTDASKGESTQEKYPRKYEERTIQQDCQSHSQLYYCPAYPYPGNARRTVGPIRLYSKEIP